MKLAYFTPLQRGSAVGQHSVGVAEELAGLGHAVELWAPELRGALHPTRLPVVRFRRRPAALTRLAQTDFAVYAIGDQPVLDGAIRDVAVHHPGVVVLHDRLTAALSGALGIVCHSARQARAVRERWPGPVCTLFLTHDLDDQAGAAVVPRRRSEPLRLLSIGHVNSNRRVGDVVEMIARRPDLAPRVRYDVVGDLDESLAHIPALRERIAALGLQDSVRLHGRLGDRELAAALHEADVHVNLCLPAFEGSSASLVRQLASAAPVVVYATGLFADLPDAVAVKVAPADIDGLGRALATLLDDPGERGAIGARGAAYVAALTPRRYAEGLAAFIVEAASRDPLLALAERAGRQLAALATHPDDAALVTVERELRALEG